MRKFGLFAIASLFLLRTDGQGPGRQDYARAVSFLWPNVNNKKAFNLFLRANWFPDSSGFWYMTQSKEGKTYQKWLKADHSIHPVVSADTVTVNAANHGNPFEEKSPDGKWIAYFSHHNLYVRATETGVSRQLSTAGGPNYDYASYYEWGEIMVGENGTRPPHFSVNWSPDSKWIAMPTQPSQLGRGPKSPPRYGRFRPRNGRA